MNPAPLFGSVFLATSVEAVEATTIVLAAGVARDWRSSLTGAGVAVAGLAATIAALGPAVSRIPLSGLRLFVGTALLLFGVQWLRKAILRAGGFMDLHDEAAIYERELATASTLSTTARWGIEDWAAFTLSFKGVLLEGLEIVVIVLTFGANDHDTPLAGVSAAVAVAVVAATGAAVRGPLTRVPENTMKFAVGVMLTSFGLFWATEGAHGSWPGGDAAVLVMVPLVLAVSAVAVAALRSLPASASRRTAGATG
ncbi:MAG TPA: FTR1 family protein [Mycobacteriales bacterium]|nr:FTR1 family protein [Mycobacteriales bacterium]HWB66404.1 FTR1 family protein [Mycobacteriales bacterium]